MQCANSTMAKNLIAVRRVQDDCFFDHRESLLVADKQLSLDETERQLRIPLPTNRRVPVAVGFRHTAAFGLHHKLLFTTDFFEPCTNYNKTPCRIASSGLMAERRRPMMMNCLG